MRFSRERIDTARRFRAVADGAVVQWAMLRLRAMTGCCFLAAAMLCPPETGILGAEAFDYPPVLLPGTHVREVRSSFVDQEYKLHIYLPVAYADSTRVFPVVYLTDSDAYFGFFRSLAANLRYGNMIPDIVIVGIAYEEDVQSYLRKRERDLLPAAIPNRPGTGAADKFFSFLKEELIPFVEAEYRVDPGDRTIAGMSGGATFALYVLCTSPELFSRYVIVSPYLVYGQEIVLDLEDAYAAQHDSLPAHVYSAMGELEPAYVLGPWKTLVVRMNKREYTDFELRHETLEGLSHMDVVFSAYARGMKEVFSDGAAALRAVPENYEACVGLYELGSMGVRFIVRLQANTLRISRAGEYWDELIPVAGARFGIEGNDEVQFSFVAGRDGAVLRMIIHQMGMENPAEKMD
jgi:predicted alpha/beta superfamily hydrolase